MYPFGVVVQGNDGARDHAGGGIRNGDIGDIFADTGGANLRLLHRVTEVFSPDVTSLLVSAQVRCQADSVVWGRFAVQHLTVHHRTKHVLEPTKRGFPVSAGRKKPI